MSVFYLQDNTYFQFQTLNLHHICLQPIIPAWNVWLQL